MKTADIQQIGAWLIERGLAGDSEDKLLQGFCEKCRVAGLPLAQGVMMVDTLHPIYEGRLFSWKADSADALTSTEYGSSRGGDSARVWQESPFYHLLSTGGNELHRRIGPGHLMDFTILDDLKAEGQTDYLAMVHRFDEGTAIGEMDCVCTRWSTAASRGFAEDELDALRSLVPSLCLGVKAHSLARIAKSLVEAYLGRDAGRRVLAGHMSRGTADRINAVLWFSDMRDYTAISESAATDQILPLLNDYAEAVISAIHSAGGDVLKLIGDGTLAIFHTDDMADACRAALAAENDLRQRLEKLNALRAAQGFPVTTIYLALHIGDVFYGNIGSRDRLDFTVIGPAVNEVARVASLCRSVDRLMLMSSDFLSALPLADRSKFVSVGRYALRGSSRALELFTLDPAMLRTEFAAQNEERPEEVAQEG
ncbi:MAG TPA: adenylate/guanylate cyclase domain-containing protein [Aestuariivirgaceae bacterium]